MEVNCLRFRSLWETPPLTEDVPRQVILYGGYHYRKFERRRVSDNNDRLLFSGDLENKIQDAEKLSGKGGFIAAVNAMFPMGIANAKTGIQRLQGDTGAKAKLIMPHTSKPVSTSLRGGRGGARNSSSSTNHYLQLKQTASTSELRKQD